MPVEIALKEPFADKEQSVGTRLASFHLASTSRKTYPLKMAWQTLLTNKVLELSGFTIPPQPKDEYFRDAATPTTPEEHLIYLYKDAHHQDEAGMAERLATSDIKLIEEQARTLVAAAELEKSKRRSGR